MNQFGPGYIARVYPDPWPDLLVSAASLHAWGSTQSTEAINTVVRQMVKAGLCERMAPAGIENRWSE